MNIWENSMNKKNMFIIFVLLMSVPMVWAEEEVDVKCASIFSDNMVLQRDKVVPVWGKAAVGEKVTVSFSGQTLEAITDKEGKWMVRLAAMKVCKIPAEMTISGSNKITIKNILIGDIWLCGGQSNMGFPLTRVPEINTFVKDDDFPLFRIARVKQQFGTVPKDEINVSWQGYDKNNLNGLPGVPTLFGRRLYIETGVPIGILQCSVGGSSTYSWISNETAKKEPYKEYLSNYTRIFGNWEVEKEKIFKESLEKYNKNYPKIKEKIKELKSQNKTIPENMQRPVEVLHPYYDHHLYRRYPGCFYNGMLYALFPFACKGIAWYQGESDRGRSYTYRFVLPPMIEDWRAQFNQGDLPFYIVQLPDIGKQKPNPEIRPKSAVSIVRESQAVVAQQFNNCEIAVIFDNNETGDVHPLNKHLPAERLARIALAKDYGKDIAFNGPTYERMEKKENTIRIHFTKVDKGLVVAQRKNLMLMNITAVDESLRHFTIAAEDRVFHHADAVIDGETVIVSSKSVSDPVAVRYAWFDAPHKCNFYDKNGLPVHQFRTDDWPLSDVKIIPLKPKFFMKREVP